MPKAKLIYLVIFVLSLILCMLCIEVAPIYILDEAKNAEAAREMWLSKNWFVPTFNDALRTDKPPLHYFFMSLGYQLFGVSAFSARIFSALFGALTFLVTFYYARLYFNQRTALIAWGILMSSVFFVQVFHQAVPDPYLIFFVSTGLFLLFDFFMSKSLWKGLLAYTCFALGILSKGPVALLLPAISVFLFLIFSRNFNFKTILNFKPFLGLLWVLILVVPWFYFAHTLTDGNWTKGFFLDHNINRFSSEKEGHGGLFLITWLYVFLGLFPFSVFIPAAIKTTWQNRREHLMLVFCLNIALTFLIFFSISQTKLPNYTMPSYPFWVFLIAFFMGKLPPEKFLRLKVEVLIVGIIMCLMPVALYFVISSQENIAEEISLIYGFLPLALGGIFMIIFFFYKKYYTAFYTLIGSWVFLSIFLFSVALPRVLHNNPVSLSKALELPTENMIVYKRLDAAFPFNYQSTFKVVHDFAEIAKMIKTYPETVVITNYSKAEELLKIPNCKRVFIKAALFENHQTQIFVFQ